MKTRSARAVGSALAAVVAVLWIVVGASKLHVDSELGSLLPAGDQSVTDLDDMAKTFGGDPLVVLIEGGGDPLSAKRLPSLLKLEGEVAAVDGVVATYGPATTLNQTVIQIKRFIADLSGRRDALADAGRTKELRALEKRYGELLVRAMPAGLPTLRNEGFVRSVVRDARTGEVKSQWRQYLPQDEVVAIYVRPREHLDQGAAARMTAAVRRAVAGSDAVPRGARVTVTGSPVVMAGLAAEVESELPRLAALAFGVVGLVLLAVPWSTRRRRQLFPLVVMSLAAGVTLATFGWLGRPLSIGAATFLPIILGLGSYYPVYLAHRGHRRTVLAAALASTAAFAAMLVSPLPFVSDLGLAVPLGLILVVGFSLLLGWWLPQALDEATAEPAAVALPPARSRKLLGWSLAVLALAGALTGWIRLGDVQLKTDPQQLVSGLPALADGFHAERVIGYGAEVDVRLRGEDVTDPVVLDWFRRAQDAVAVRFGDRLHPVTSLGYLLGFLGRTPTHGQVKAGLASLPDYVTSAVVSSDAREALMSLGVAWSDLSSDRALVSDMRAELPPPPAGYTVSVSGLPVTAERGYDLISAHRYDSSLLALGGAFVALLLALRRRRDAVVGLLSAGAASGLAVLIVSLAGFTLNPLTLALGVLTAATGSEFAVLLAEARRTGDAKLARSVTLAALLSAGGYSVLITSNLPVLRELGAALAGSVLLSAACAVLFSYLLVARAEPTGGADQERDDQGEWRDARALESEGRLVKS